MKHFLTTQDITKENITRIFETNVGNLSQKILGTLFFEPSTRTRWSTEIAMLKLGGQVVSMEAATQSSSYKKGESLEDTVKVCSQNVDCLVIRHPENGEIEKAARHSKVPVINAGSGNEEHPTQALIDLYTILQYYPEDCIKDLRIMFTGDLEHSRTVKSLMPLLKLYGISDIMMHNCCHNIGWTGSAFIYYNDEIYHQLPKIDILYMTRHQEERERNRKKSDFKMTYQFAEVMQKTAIIMHPLPRNEEIDISTDDNKRAVYFKQAENGLTVRMKLLYDMLK